MDEQIERQRTPRKYKWPWFVLAAVVLGILLAIIWMALEVRKVREQRDPMRYQQNFNGATRTRFVETPHRRRESEPIRTFQNRETA